MSQGDNGLRGYWWLHVGTLAKRTVVSHVALWRG